MTKATAAGQQGPATLIRCERIHLVAPRKAAAAAVLEFYQRNQAHFARWDPPMPPGFLSVSHQAERIGQASDAFTAGTGFRYWLVEPSAPRRVVGSVHFSSVVRGAFQSAMLGYALDEALQGRGLMTEALQAGIAEMFSARVNLHRVQAAVQPDNARSIALVARLGFDRIGLAPGYLWIAGAWRDHLLWQRLNPAST